VQAALTGFQTSIRSGIQLTVGREAVVNLRLSIGEITERVVVQGEASLVETTSSALSELVDERKILDLPLNGRSFTQLALLQMGIGAPKTAPNNQTGNTGQKISVSGTRTTETAFLMDGVDMRGNRQTTPTSEAGILMGVDTVREFSVVSGIAGAEYGGFTGGVINIVSKSGTNQFHGTVFEFHRNKSLDAANFFDNKFGRDKPPFIRNQFGFTVGGPIVSDRTFIFGSYEGLRDRTSSTLTATVPDDRMHQGFLPLITVPNCPDVQGNECFLGVDDAIQPYLDIYPRANGASRGGGRAQHIFTDSKPTDVDFYMTRFDHTFSDSDSVYVRYTLDESSTNVAEALPVWRVNRSSRNQYAAIGYTKVLSTSLINEFRVGYNRTNAKTVDEEAVAIDPALKFNPNYVSQGNIGFRFAISEWGPSIFRGLLITLNRFEYADTLSYNRGRHSLKFGGQFVRLQFNVFSQIRSRGNYTFNSMADFLTNSPFLFAGQTTPPFTLGIRETMFSFFIQDNFQFRPNLTFNMGLRYEGHTDPSEVAGRTANLDNFSDSAQRIGGSMLGRNPSRKNFAPRLGFAWDISGDGKTSLRGGYGIFFDLYDSTTWVGAPEQNAPFNVFVNFRFPEFPDPFGPGGPDSSLPARPNLWMYGTLDQPYIQQWSLTLQQEILPLTVVTVSYNGSRGVKLMRSVTSNTRVPQIANGRIVYDPNGPLRNDSFDVMNSYRTDSDSNYHGLRLGVNRRFSQGLQFQTSYTWSHAIDDTSNQGPFDGAGGSSDNLQDFPDAGRANSNMDLRNVFTTNVTYSLPGPSPQTVAGKVLGGWRLSGILNLADGSPYNNSMTWSHAKTGLSGGIWERPDLRSGADNNPVNGDGRDPDAYFTRGNFVLAEPGIWGNLGRNTMVLGGFATLDISLQKDTPIAGERVKLQFRAEFFNLLNRANWGPPGRTSFATSFTSDPKCGINTSSGVPCSTIPESGSFGKIASTSGSNRQIQFALKLIF